MVDRQRATCSFGLTAANLFALAGLSAHWAHQMWDPTGTWRRGPQRQSVGATTGPGLSLFREAW
jgi:hypothetical protein